MIALLLETSGKQGFVALSEAGNLVAVRTLDESRRHARDLAPLVGEILRERQVSSLAVGVVAVSQGPGSYTGLRVGIASALAFRFATDCHMMLVPTFFFWPETDPWNGSRQPRSLKSLVMPSKVGSTINGLALRKAIGGPWTFPVGAMAGQNTA